MTAVKFKTAAAGLFALAVFAGFHSVAVGAMDWPSETAGLIRNFGANDTGKPVLGMVFSGDTEILAAERGEVIFSRGRDGRASRLPSPLGAWTAVDHGDGLISIYSRYDTESQPPARVERQDTIAASGISGWSSRNGFFFQVYDRRERRWINPAMIMTPQREILPPQILSVELRNAQGVPIQAWNVSQGRYTVVVNTNIPRAPRDTFFAPQRIICLVNGTEAGSLNFEAISARDGVLMVNRNGLVPAKQVYAASPAFEVADIFLNRGQVSLEIIVQDISGNSSGHIIRMIVN